MYVCMYVCMYVHVDVMSIGNQLLVDILEGHAHMWLLCKYSLSYVKQYQETCYKDTSKATTTVLFT